MQTGGEGQETPFYRENRGWMRGFFTRRRAKCHGVTDETVAPPGLTVWHMHCRSDKMFLLNKEFPRQRIKIIYIRKPFENLCIFYCTYLLLLFFCA